MEKENLNKINEVVEMLGWEMDHNENEYELQMFSPEGQDFTVSITAESENQFIEELKEYYQNFDVSYETYLWLDEDGHGKNGAPDDMRDLYNDMEHCIEEVSKLIEELESIDFD